MGWNPFKSKRVTTIDVATVAQRLIEDDNLPDAIKTGVIKAILREENVTDTVIEDLIGSLGVRAERAYAYAEKHYTHGLPSGEIYSSTQGWAQVEAVIEAAEGQQVVTEYSRHGPANALHVGWVKLIQDHGYSHTTNQLAGLTATKGTPVYLKDMVVVVPAHLQSIYEPDVLAQWGISAKAGFTPERTSNGSIGLQKVVESSPVFINAAATELYVAVTYVWESGSHTYEGSLSISLNDYSADQNYFQAKYVADDVVKYFIYAQGTGTHPTLDDVFAEKTVVNGTYFPFVYFRNNKQSVIQDKTTPAYKTSRTLTKYFGMDFDTVAKGIDSNPDIDDVQQAMMIMAVPAVTTDPVECRYLFDYFEAMNYAMDDGTSSYTALNRSDLSGLQPDAVQGKRRAFLIQDKQFKMVLSIGGITKRLVVGSIGKLGTHSSAYSTRSVSETAYDVDLGEDVTSTRLFKEHVYKKQITSVLYEEVTVLDLSMTYFVSGQYTTTGDETDEILLIPIDMSISSQWTIQERETLYARSMHFIFNTLVITVTKVKWYQTGAFKTLMLIVAIVMIVVDGGATMGVYLGLTGTAAIVASILITLYVMPAVFKLIVKLVGADVATILAIALVVYAAHHFATSPGMAGVPTANQLVSFATGLNGAVIQDMFSDLLLEQQGFFQFMEEQTKTLDEANKLLESTSFLSPFVIFGESPQDFYNRTVHSGNVGVLSISAISSYVDIALTLPKLDESIETIGESNNGISNGFNEWA
jgi:hypothetical protein